MKTANQENKMTKSKFHKLKKNYYKKDYPCSQCGKILHRSRIPSGCKICKECPACGKLNYFQGGEAYGIKRKSGT